MPLLTPTAHWDKMVLMRNHLLLAFRSLNSTFSPWRLDFLSLSFAWQFLWTSTEKSWILDFLVDLSGRFPGRFTGGFIWYVEVKIKFYYCWTFLFLICNLFEKNFQKSLATYLMIWNIICIHILGGEKSKESFLQDGSCSSVAPRLAKCRECKAAKSQRGKPLPSIFCRFYAFRRRVNFLSLFLSCEFLLQCEHLWYLCDVVWAFLVFVLRSVSISCVCVIFSEHFSCLCDFVWVFLMFVWIWVSLFQVLL